MNFKGKTIISLCAGALAVGAMCFTGVSGRNNTANARKYLSSQNNQQVKVENTLQNKKDKVFKRVNHDITVQNNKQKNNNQSSQPKNTISKDNQTFLNEINPNIDYFFNVYYRYDNHDSYIHRANKLVDFVSSSVLHNHTLFDNDGGGNSNSSVNLKKIQCRYDNERSYIINQHNDNVKLLTAVRYDAKSGDDDYATGEKWFEIDYNLSSQNITNVVPLYRQNNIHAK